MARKSLDREDLLRDATAFGTRLQLSITRYQPSLEFFAGIRAQGAASFYCDQDPVYHFNAKSQLRRAFVDNALVKAKSGKLIVLRRRPTEVEVTMHPHTMSAGEQQRFCRMAKRRLVELRQAIVEGDYHAVGYVAPTGITREAAMVQLVAALEQCSSFEVAASPRIGSETSAR